MQRISLRLSILPPMPLRQHFSPLHLQSPQIYLPPTKTESSKRRTNYFSRDAAVRPHLSFPTSTAAEEKRLRYPVKFSDVASSQIPPSIPRFSISRQSALPNMKTNLVSLVLKPATRKSLTRPQNCRLTVRMITQFWGHHKIDLVLFFKLVHFLWQSNARNQSYD